MQNRKIFIITLTLALALSATAVLAEEGSTTNTNRQRPGQELKTRLQDRWNKQCETLEARVDLQITRYDNNKGKHLAIYDRMKEKLAKVLERAVGAGYDVAQLQADVATWQTKIDKFKTDYAAYIDKLKATQNYACGNSQGQFLAALKDAKAALRVVHQDSIDIRLFYQQTVLADLRALKAQKTGQTADRPSSDEANGESSSNE
ncbi:hypothetical protein HY933_01040 [Candidatus Falkowbacteria bacterium]|nr:hypothetical protein [Candidatus Falkowbacteria bacterium]